MLERTEVITNEVPEPITFALAYPTVIIMKITNKMQLYRLIYYS